MGVPADRPESAYMTVRWAAVGIPVHSPWVVSLGVSVTIDTPERGMSVTVGRRPVVAAGVVVVVVVVVAVVVVELVVVVLALGVD